MTITIEEKDIEKIILVGDRVLVKPKKDEGKTKTGLYLPPTVKENEKIYQGYVIKSGPGFPIPALTEADEPWKRKEEQVQYVPLQARQGDLAVYLQNNGYEIEFKGDKYVVVPHNAILMLIRDEDLFT